MATPRPVPRYIRERPAADQAGLVSESHLPLPLPYGLQPRDFLRVVEDVHDLLFDINSLLHERAYRRAELLLDPAGFSGLISRTVADRLASASRALVLNRHHNGYPDLLVRGQYPGDAVERGEGGLEIKASRFEGGWQSHGPRAGWFAIFQFELDERDDVAVFDLNPTRVRAVLVALLQEGDWSWQPAAPGKIRSGTASVKPSAVAKLRAGAAWVDPDYRTRHIQLLGAALMSEFRSNVDTLVIGALSAAGRPLGVSELASQLAGAQSLKTEAVESSVRTALSRLRRGGRVTRERPGLYALS